MFLPHNTTLKMDVNFLKIGCQQWGQTKTRKAAGAAGHERQVTGSPPQCLSDGGRKLHVCRDCGHPNASPIWGMFSPLARGHNAVFPDIFGETSIQ